jgi:hypothetical protein
MNKLRFLATLVVVILCCGAADGCKGPEKKPDADPTTKGAVSPLPGAIAKTGTNATAALAASEAKAAATEKLASKAAASVAAIRTGNTNQPPGPATEFVDKEAGVALGNLPAPDATTALEAERRRAAVFAGQAEEARKLYAAATSAADAAKAEVARLSASASEAKAKAEAAQAALVDADKRWAATLKANEAANQAKLDDANQRADEAEEKAKNERHKLIFRSLLGLGLACIAGAIAMAVLTQGAMLAKSLMLAGGGALCIGVAQIVSHPWFDRIFGGCVALAAIGGGAYLYFEWQDAVKKRGFDKTVSVMDRVELSAVPAKSEDGKDSNLALELSRKFGDAEKAVVKKLRLVQAVRAAKAEAKA